MKTALSLLIEFIESKNPSQEEIKKKSALLKREEMTQIREAFLSGMDYGRGVGSSFDHPDMLYYTGTYIYAQDKDQVEN